MLLPIGQAADGQLTASTPMPLMQTGRQLHWVPPNHSKFAISQSILSLPMCASALTNHTQLISVMRGQVLYINYFTNNIIYCNLKGKSSVNRHNTYTEPLCSNAPAKYWFRQQIKL